ncbi:MAG: AI-2E family transporter, partial [Flammeovirgaceae bacterium]|nr:AI-2E family transporter [Flammeovirgaceae bacterium]
MSSNFDIKPQRFDRLDYIYKLFVVIALSITATMLASDIIIPILISAFLSVVLLPVVNRLEKKLSLTLSVTIVLIFTFILFAGSMWIIGKQLANLVQDLPDLQTRFEAFVNKTSDQIELTLGFSAKEQTQLLKDGLTAASSYLTNLVVSTTNTLSLLVQIPIYIFLFLIYRDKFRDFFVSLLPSDDALGWKKDIENV